MFRRLSHTLPKDPEFPADLEGLGYFINDKDQIRSIARPDHEFNFFISKNERVNEKQREAMNTCVRTNLSTRFAAAGLDTIHFGAGPGTPSIPILASTNLKTAPRLLIYFGESTQDLGILAYRNIGQQCIAAGSILPIYLALKNDTDNPALLIANCGQLLWHRRGGCAVTQQTWNALPMKTGVEGIMRIDPLKNRVKGHGSVEEHIASVMAFVQGNAGKETKIEIVGMGDASDDVVKYLSGNWGKWKGRVEAVAIGMAYNWFEGERKGWSEEFSEFWSRRARVYVLSPAPLDIPLEGRKSFGCNVYSSGAPSYTECIMPVAWKAILPFFKLVADVPGYAEVEMEIIEEVVEGRGEDGEGADGWGGGE